MLASVTAFGIAYAASAVIKAVGYEQCRTYVATTNTTGSVVHCMLGSGATHGKTLHLNPHVGVTLKITGADDKVNPTVMSGSLTIPGTAWKRWNASGGSPIYVADLSESVVQALEGREVEQVFVDGSWISEARW